MNKYGIKVEHSRDTRLEQNDASESEGTGIEVSDLSFENVIVRNNSSGNDGAGIVVSDEAGAGSGSIIERNRTNNNKGYGIFVPKVSHEVRDNVANDNETWGIWVSEGSNGRVNIDGGGNTGQGNLGPLDPATLKPLQCYSVRCDGTAAPSDLISPNTTIVAGPADETYDDVGTFRFAGTDNASGTVFQCRLDSTENGDWRECQSPYSEIVTVGPHTFEVRAVDTSGNADPTPAVHTWDVLAPLPFRPPVTTIHSGPDATTTRTDALFEFSADERIADFTCWHDKPGAGDAPTYAPCAWLGMPTIMFARGSVQYAALAVGVHQFKVRAADRDINPETGLPDPNVGDPATWSWKVEPPPVAAEVVCGEIIVESIRLTHDLIDCEGTGLVIGRTGITLDLDGHVIDGVGLDSGVLNPGFDNVTVTNGQITEFDYGVQLGAGTGRSVVTDLRVELTQEAGIALADADQLAADGSAYGNTVRGNTLVTNKVGIAVYSGTRNAIVRDNAIGGSALDGVRLEHTRGSRIERNEITGSSGAGVMLQGGRENVLTENLLEDNKQGIMVGEELIPSNDNLVERNTIEGLSGGISVIDSVGNDILENRIGAEAGGGVTLELARDTVVRANNLAGSKEGIVLDESQGNLLEINNASGTLGTGISVGSLSPNNDLVMNTASENGGEGIEIDDAPPTGQGNLLERNDADGNAGDGIALNGVGHIVDRNSAQRNGGWGIYAAVGAIDRGGNFAAGNVEPLQCLNVVCEIGSVPGEPETWIVDAPPALSNSRNASFTYRGRDELNLERELVFECRIDSQDPFAWEDCEYPADITNLSPGTHTFEIRAIDLGLLADSTPAKYVWTYEPLPANDPPEVIIDLGPPAQTWLPDAIFTFHANEPDVTMECKVDEFGWEPCSFEEPVNQMHKGGFEWGLEETEVGEHTFYVRATDFEGNVGEPTEYKWSLLGVATEFLPGPDPESTGFTPPETPIDLATGGETLSTTAVIDFQSNMADATFECSLDLEPFVPCTPPVTYTGLLPGDHNLRVIATADGMEEQEPAEYEWGIVEGIDLAPPETTFDLRPTPGSSSTKFEFSGTDDLTPPELLIFECRMDSQNELDWQECTSPFNLLDLFTYEDPQMAPGQHTFEVRAIDTSEPPFENPNNPNFEGNPDPTPATYTWNMTADTTPPTTGITSGPANGERVGLPDALFDFAGFDNATPELRMEFECKIDAGLWEPCESPGEVGGLEPGPHTFSVRAIDMALNVDTTPATRTFTVVPPPVTTITSGPGTPNAEGELVSKSDSAVFAFRSDQPGSTFECALDEGGLNPGENNGFFPCTSPVAYFSLEDGEHTFEVRATNPEGVIEEPPVLYEWFVELGPDTVAPDTRITSGPAASDALSVATFEFTGSDNRAAPLTFECALDGQAYNSCVSPQQFSDLTTSGCTSRRRSRRS
jgi:parallel beta-helix repeat protein